MYIYFWFKLNLFAPVTINCLGHLVKLGDLYDWPTQQFTGQSLFSNGLPEKIQRQPLFGRDDIQVFPAESTYALKFQLFEIESVDTQLSILSSTFPLSGSAKFFRHRVTNKKTLQRFWTFNRNIKFNGISFNSHEVKPYVDNTTLLNTDATHVAVELSYGIRAIISIETKQMIMDNQTEYWGNYLQNVLTKIRLETVSEN